MRGAIGDGERVRDEVAKLKRGLSSSEEGLDPIAEVGGEFLVVEDLSDMAGVDIVEEARDVEE